MQFSAKAEYACLSMLELAVRHDDPRPVRLADVADQHGIPQRFLVQILLQLKGAGLVASTRGASGGYQLARPPADITLFDILEVVDRSDDEVSKTNRPTNKKGDASSLSSALHGVWDRIVQSRQQILKQTTLAHLVEAGQGLQYVI
ncbi:RrF2 family transcriptional regulator [Fimbriiglobus ruber]|uniref:Rrf2 family transcriptional regulator n=1 Tax=Fimbriiglobus ruber TaxID=1908690 RepID=A0A225DI71_9BACT|nr:Rrf2 family transcriptional regulator [Fimbriiglobus ruber]OWK36075.1 Rrf2 family transcriptional regulator [Fimbriiglobus ruber]